MLAESDKTAEVRLIGLSQSSQVLLARLAGRAKSAVPSAPRERLMVMAFEEHICCKPRMPAVAVHERMDRYESMVKPNRKLRPGKDLVLDPVSDIAAELSDLLIDLGVVDTDVRIVRSVLPGPPPRLTEHLLV